MNISKYSDDNLLIVCPNEEKEKILIELNNTNKLYNIKFMTKEEFKKNYFFSYNDKAISYLMNKYNYNIDVSKVYLESLYVIDDDKTYKNEKLIFLQGLKKELLKEGLLQENKLFKTYLIDKKIIVKNYYNLDLYEEKMLGIKTDYQKKTLNKQVVEANTLEEEVNYVCLKIIALINNNVDINKIYLTNVTDEYLYTIKKIFSYYKIPINIDMKNSIYTTKVVSDFLTTKKLDLVEPSKAFINSKIISILSSLSFLEEDSKTYQELLIDKLKNTYIIPVKNINAVNIKNLYNETFNKDEHVFVLGLNQDVLPTLYKDTAYLSDNLKDEIDLYKTSDLNKRSKLALIEVFNNINNLYISYKLSSPFNNFYKSSIINDLDLEIIKPIEDLYNKSNLYNKIRLSKKLDQYELYGIKDDTLKILYTSYQIPYKTYSNSFDILDEDLYKKNLPYPLKLSYTSMNAYSECKFKYYIKHVLKLEPYKDSFQAFVGSLYHEILSLYQKTNFNLEEEYQKYLSKRKCSLKEKLLLIRIRKDLTSLISKLKQQTLLTGYDNYLFEKKIDIDISEDISVIFTGTIDKIMYYQKIEDTYFTIVDYKTGFIDTNIEPMKYGLNMQLPVYLYLIHYSKVLLNPIFTGAYYQNILFNYPKWDKNIDKIKQEQLLLKGYSTDEVENLERFDPTFEKSEVIKSMSYNEDKGFNRNSKIIDNDTLYNLVVYTKNYINKTKHEILKADFTINPKIYDGKNISCEFCSFKDLCYMKEKDLVYLDKVEDLSFLGGDESA